MSEQKQVQKSILGTAMCLFLLVGLFALCLVLFTGCTLSFQNIDTHGMATDLVDENQATSPTVSVPITVPVKPL
jgi:hypothetical protein